jgi:hypothetical protein
MGLGNRMCLYKLSSLLKIVANKMNLVMITGMFPYNVSKNEKVHINLIFDILQVESGFELTTLVVIGTDGTGSCKSNYHTITTTTAPPNPIHIQL